MNADFELAINMIKSGLELDNDPDAICDETNREISMKITLPLQEIEETEKKLESIKASVGLLGIKLKSKIIPIEQ